jgi:hypothetical protein
MVGTSGMAQVTATRVEDGIHLSIRFSGLEVGTVGGGTGLPHARAYLQLMDCFGPGKVYRFAQIIAATALCLELSATASMATTGSTTSSGARAERGAYADRGEHERNGETEKRRNGEGGSLLIPRFPDSPIPRFLLHPTSSLQSLLA